MNFKNMFKVEKKHDIMQRITNKMPYRKRKKRVIPCIQKVTAT